MKLQGRNLSINLQGDDVALLQKELSQLNLTIPDAEARRSLFGPGTMRAVEEFQRAHALEATGIVDEPTATAINAAVSDQQPRVVRGSVSDANGRPVAGVIVRAFDKDLRSEQPLGEIVSGRDGIYEISYTPVQFSRAEKQSADLVVRAFKRTAATVVTTDGLLAESDVVFNAKPEETINLRIRGRGLSEYEQLAEAVTPLLQGVAITELTEDDKHQDVSFLSNETGQDASHIAYLIVAHRLVRKSDLHAEVFYAFFRQGLPTNLPALLALHPDLHRRALENAIEANIIPVRFRNELKAILERIKVLIVQHAFEAPGEGKSSLSALLSTTLSDRTKQIEFLTAYANHRGPIQEFWSGIAQRPDFKNIIDALQETLQLGALTRDHLPLVQEIQRRQRLGEIEGLKDLARFSVDDWKRILETQTGAISIGAPTDVPGKNEEEKRQNYATALARTLEVTFPNAAFASQIERDDLEGKGDLVRFLSNNPDFHLGNTNLEDYLKRNAEALNGVENTGTLTTGLKAMQRVFKLTPHYSEIRTLLKDDLHSAHDVVRMGQNAFAIQYGPALGGVTKAKALYQKASQISATAKHLLAEYGPMFHSPGLQVLPGYKGTPELTTLFGRFDLCDCGHCQSVYSPAAYLVDILHFLKDRKLVDQIDRDQEGNVKKITYKKKTLPNGSQVVKSVKDVLFERRPDLGEIQLTCENTNTPLPYVDLVNEILEDAISPFEPFTPFTLASSLETDLDSGQMSEPLRNVFNSFLSPSAAVTVVEKGIAWMIAEPAYIFTVRKDDGDLQVASRSRQTTGSTEELRANPQYVNVGAYEKIGQAAFPWLLPFDLWTEEVRVYLNHLGLPRNTLMKTFQKPGDSGEPGEVAIASEHLGLTTADVQIITGSLASEPWSFWGYQQAQAGTWVGNLGDVSKFLDRSGLTYQELTDLLKLKFVNPDGSITVVSKDEDDPATCDVTKLRLLNLTEESLSLTHRLVRLWRKLGWTMRILDKTITALQPDVSDGNQLSEALLLRLSHVVTLRNEFNLPVESLLSLWSNIDTDGVDSSYHRLFQNPAVLNPVDAAFKLDGDELNIVTAAPDDAKISKHKPTILAALRINESDLAVMTAPVDPVLKAGLNTSELAALEAIEVDDTLNLANLSKLYRITILAKVLRLPVKDTVTLIALTLVNPFDVIRTQDTLRLVEIAGKMRSADSSVDEIDYLLRHRNPETVSAAPTDDKLMLTLDDLRRGLKQIAQENTFTPDMRDPTGELISKKLAILLPSSEVDKTMSLLAGTWTSTEAAEFIDSHLAAFLDTADAKAQLTGPSPLLTEPGERYLYALAPLLNYLRQSLSESLVKQKLSETLKLETKVIGQLLTQWITSPAHPAEKAIADFNASTFVDSNIEISRAAFPDQFNTLTLMSKIALVITEFKVTPTQLAWLFNYGPDVGWLDLNTLPLSLTGSSSARFESWASLVDLFRLRDQLPSGALVLDEVFRGSRDGQTSHEALLEQLHKDIGWNLNDLKFLCGPEMFNFNFPTAYQDERALDILRSSFAIMKRVGMSAAECVAWAQPNLNEAEARSIKQAVKSKYGEDQWPILAKPLRDALRDQQRASLLSYLIAHPDTANGQKWTASSDLYSHFLIDVEMASCQMTSRIKQAIGSIQLFVQRCLMNLEPEVLATAEADDKWREWKWMKNYRVWEANRKVFLYPENWIEPELRDDKSPFFKDLEGELLQNDLTQDSAESAFMHYLDKLDAVARLEIVGMYHQLESVTGAATSNLTTNVLHVFGRTQGSPPGYYYRRHIDSHWTAWERVELDIEGDHLIPLVWNRRLYLFWPIFTEKFDDSDKTMPAAGDALPKGKPYWEIQLAWSEYKNGKWTAKKVSKTVGGETEFPAEGILTVGHTNRSWFVFKGLLDGEELTIGCYVSLPQLLFRGGMGPIGYFKFDDRHGAVQAFESDVNDPYYAESPLRTSYRFMSFSEAVEYESTSEAPGFEEEDRLYPWSAKGKDVPILNKTPGDFSLLYPHQDLQFHSQRPFFFADAAKTFFVVPVTIPFRGPIPDKQSIESGFFSDSELGRWAGILDPAGPVTTPQKVLHGGDPIISELSFPVSSNSSVALSMSRQGDGLRRAQKGLAQSAKVKALVNAKAILASPVAPGYLLPVFQARRRYAFQTFYHPYVGNFVKQLNRDGADGVLQRPLQMLSHQFFAARYEPHKVEPQLVTTPYPREDVDFSYDGAYSLYNWELFFHAPLLIGDRLSKNQRFEEAMKWFHYIFDPTDTSSLPSPQRFWRTRPFYETTKPEYQAQQIQNLLHQLASGENDPELEKQVAEWRKHPFKPHLIARLRTTSYQKTVVMKYIDNLIAWGDQLFRRDTIESINEATQLYILAAEILGKRNEDIPPRVTHLARTYNDLEPTLDDFSNTLIQIENMTATPADGSATPMGDPPVTLSALLYFCVPKNDKLNGYWDTVADRLFKLRNCMNIEGIVRELPLFEPPIDPALLVKAAAAGVDLNSVLNDLNAASPRYRFNVMTQKASELCSEVRALGGHLLSVLEKQDAEELALLRSGQEGVLLESMEDLKEQQVNEAFQHKVALMKSLDIAVARYRHYQKLLGVPDLQAPTSGNLADHPPSGQAVTKDESKVKMIEGETKEMASMDEANDMQRNATGWEMAANIAHTVGDIVAAPWGAGIKISIGSALSAVASYHRMQSANVSYDASRFGKLAQYVMRAHEWILQSNLAAKEIMQINQQIVAAEVREAISKRELDHHQKQIEQARNVDEFMHSKYTNQELYSWMVGQLSMVYFQSYQLAYEVAKRAERAYRFELALKDSNFIQFGYWDSLKRGLLAGERLFQDIKRMEVAYLDQNKREYEITKHVSVTMLDPLALINLKETGQCEVWLTESLFDADYPGHYMRRIKNVGLTIPCVVGPYTSINCTLTLLDSETRTNSVPAQPYGKSDTGDDPRFVANFAAQESIVTSHAQNDAGMFELNFRDERYLPFEGAGAVSHWRIELPKDNNAFDFDTLTDVVLHIRYTAREGGELLRGSAAQATKDLIENVASSPLARLFSLKNEFPSEWHRFLHFTEPPSGANRNHRLKLDLRERFPFLFRGMKLNIKEFKLFLKLKDGYVYDDSEPLPFHLNGVSAQFEKNQSMVEDLPFASVPGTESSPLEQTLEVPASTVPTVAATTPEKEPVLLLPNGIEDIWMICEYAVAEKT